MSSDQANPFQPIRDTSDTDDPRMIRRGSRVPTPSGSAQLWAATAAVLGSIRQLVAVAEAIVLEKAESIDSADGLRSPTHRQNSPERTTSTVSFLDRDTTESGNS